METKHTEENIYDSLRDRFETAVFYLEVVDKLSTQLHALRQQGSWTPSQRFSLWCKAVRYRFTRWRLNRWFKRIGDPECLSIPERHGLVFRAIEKPDCESALDCLKLTGEFSCCLVPSASKSQRQGFYKRAKKRGYDIRIETRPYGLLIERLCDEG
jgi:hypothetical protein